MLRFTVVCSSFSWVAMIDIVESYECRKKIDDKFHIYVKVIVSQDGE